MKGLEGLEVWEEVFERRERGIMGKHKHNRGKHYDNVSLVGVFPHDFILM